MSLQNREKRLGNVDVNKDALLGYEAPTGPIVMVNLFRLKDKAQFGEFLQAMRSVSEQTLQASGAETVYAGAVGGEFIAGGDHWDRLVLVRYPSWEAFCDALGDDDVFDEVRDIRRKYLADARFMVTTPLGASRPDPSEQAVG